MATREQRDGRVATNASRGWGVAIPRCCHLDCIVAAHPSTQGSMSENDLELPVISENAVSFTCGAPEASARS